MTNQQETLYAIALAQLCRYSPTTALQLYKEGGSATTLMEHRHNIKTLFPNANTRLIETFRQADQALRQAEKELKYNIEHNIKTLLINDEDYPARLRECTDAPLVIFYKGTATLNPTHAIAIVGTRRCTTYGQDITRRFIKDLQNHCPGILIVSGLAYGIDICAHREALAEKNETIGVLAHGLDQLYPAHHKQTAQEMTKQGGLLTEFMTETQAEKMHFVQRNRIVAGMCDACIVVESGERGGSLITADIARSYDRDVFAFPGRVGDKTSAGCNRLIRDNVAALIQNADDLIKAMRWENINLLKQAKQTGIQPQLFPELTPDEQKIIKTLNEKNDQQMNTLAVNCGLPVNRLSAILSQLFSFLGFAERPPLPRWGNYCYTKSKNALLNYKFRSNAFTKLSFFIIQSKSAGRFRSPRPFKYSDCAIYLKVSYICSLLNAFNLKSATYRV